MNYRTFIGGFSALVLIAMLAVTSWASMEKNVVEGFRILLAERWGVATLFDAYFGFLFFYVWIFYKESALGTRVAWLLGVLCFGNIAMAIYVLNEIRRLPRGAPIDRFLLRRA